MKLKTCNEQIHDPYPILCGKIATYKLNKYDHSIYLCDEHQVLYEGKFPSRKLGIDASEILKNDYPIQEEIYELKDPRDGMIHYVGRSIDVWRRWYSHQSHPQPGRMAEWIKELKLLGLSPVLDIVCSVNQEHARHREAEQIQKRIQEGCKLYNLQKPTSDSKKI